MIDLIKAEWRKMSGNRWTAGFLIWIFPIGAFAATILLLVMLAVSDSFRLNIAEQPTVWTEQFLSAFGLLNNQFGRLFFTAFAVIMFAGEYKWGTWKNVVPRHRRTQIIVAKLLTLGLFVLTSMVSMAILWGLGRVIVGVAAGSSIEPALSGSIIGSFLIDVVQQVAITYTAVLIVASFAALISIVTRSIIGGLVVGVGLLLIEPLFVVASFVAAISLDAPSILSIIRLTTMYNFDNIASWVQYDRPTSIVDEVALTFGDAMMFSDSLSYSVGVIAVWAVVMITAMIWLFNRQDITT